MNEKYLYLYYMFKYFLKIEQSIHHEPTIQKQNKKKKKI